jgi:hypothetical protein
MHQEYGLNNLISLQLFEAILQGTGATSFSSASQSSALLDCAADKDF